MIRSGPSALRSWETYTWSAVWAVSGGEASQSSSMSRSRETTSLACSSKEASRARCSEPRSGTRTPPSLCPRPTSIGQDGTGLASERPLRVGLVVEPAGIEHPYMHGAYLGLDRAVREL